MKVAILSLPLMINYGGILQSWALQTVLERCGCEVFVINTPYRRKLPFRRWFTSIPKRIFLKYFFKKRIVIFEEYHINKTYPIVSQFTQRFIEKNIRLYNINKITDLREGMFDTIVVGSDQIWRSTYYKPENAFLQFAEKWKIKRIAYAPSFGKSNWEYSASQTSNCRRLIHLFDAVSVRETSGVKLCEDYLGITPQLVLDPTFLLSKEDYLSLLPECVRNSANRGGGILTYVLGDNDEIRNLIKKVERNRGLSSFSVNAKAESASVQLHDRIQPPVELWLEGFHKADFVITDSFHACVFSILFGKPFIVIGNRFRGMSRFESLLTMFGLESHLITKADEYDICNDYAISPEVYTRVDIYKKASFDFLHFNLCS